MKLTLYVTQAYYRAICEKFGVDNIPEYVKVIPDPEYVATFDTEGVQERLNNEERIAITSFIDSTVEWKTTPEQEKEQLKIIIANEQKQIMDALGIRYSNDKVTEHTWKSELLGTWEKLEKVVKFSEEIDRKVYGNYFIENKMKKHKPRWQR